MKHEEYQAIWEKTDFQTAFVFYDDHCSLGSHHFLQQVLSYSDKSVTRETLIIAQRLAFYYEFTFDFNFEFDINDGFSRCTFDNITCDKDVPLDFLVKVHHFLTFEYDRMAEEYLYYNTALFH